MREPLPVYVDVDTLKHLFQTDSALTLVDARSPEEYDKGHVPTSINIPIANLEEFTRNQRMGKEGLIVTMCGSTGRGEKAAGILSAAGIENVQVLRGGLKAWREAGLPVA